MVVCDFERDDGSHIAVAAYRLESAAIDAINAAPLKVASVGRYKPLLRALITRMTEEQLNGIVAAQLRATNTVVVLFDDILKCFSLSATKNSNLEILRSDHRERNKPVSPPSFNRSRAKSCICGRFVRHPFRITNVETHESYAIGSECVKNWSPHVLRALRIQKLHFTSLPVVAPPPRVHPKGPPPRVLSALARDPQNLQLSFSQSVSGKQARSTVESLQSDQRERSKMKQNDCAVKSFCFFCTRKTVSRKCRSCDTKRIVQSCFDAWKSLRPDQRNRTILAHCQNQLCGVPINPCFSLCFSCYREKNNLYALRKVCQTCARPIKCFFTFCYDCRPATTSTTHSKRQKI